MDGTADQALVDLATDVRLLLREVRALRNDIVSNTTATQLLTEVLRRAGSVQSQPESVHRAD